MKTKIRLIVITLLVTVVFILVSCGTEAEKVSYNVSKEAENFNVLRRLVVLNMRTDRPIFEVIGTFSIDVDTADDQLEVTAEVEPGVYRKHFIGLTEWETYFVEDLDETNVNQYRYEVSFLPESILPYEITTESGNDKKGDLRLPGVMAENDASTEKE